MTVDATRCATCLRDPPAFDRTLTAADYDAPIDRLVLAMKYDGRLDIAQLCVSALTPLLQEETGLPDLLCPVPLGRRRLCERGYNQALEIARPLSRTLRVRLEARLLERNRDTGTQAGLPAALRRANVKGAFAIAPGVEKLARDLHVGVVDDVMTTGATLDEIASTLKQAGAAKVTNIVFARTPH